MTNYYLVDNDSVYIRLDRCNPRGRYSRRHGSKCARVSGGTCHCNSNGAPPREMDPLWALIEAADFDLVNGCPGKWYAVWKAEQRTFYVSMNRRPSGTGQHLLHRVILGLDGTCRPLVDHVKHDGLDNRRSNLRLSTHSENARNTRRRDGYISPYTREGLTIRVPTWGQFPLLRLRLAGIRGEATT